MIIAYEFVKNNGIIDIDKLILNKRKTIYKSHILFIFALSG